MIVHNLKSLKGFTLVELLVSIVIVAILSTIGLVVYSNFLRDARDGKRQSDLKIIQAGLEQYYADQFFYPNTPSASFPFGAALTSSTGNPTPPSPAKNYMNIVPNDPQPSPQPRYRYEKQPSTCDNSATSKCSGYCLHAKVENTSSAVNLTSCTDISGYNYEVTLP